MPVNHRTYFGKDRCPKNPNLPKGFCEPGSRPFVPHTRTTNSRLPTVNNPVPSPPTDDNPPPSPPTVDDPVFFFPVSYEPLPPPRRDDGDKPSATGTASGGSGVRPLKNVAELTPEQLENGRMIAAGYELNELVNTQAEGGDDFDEAVQDVMETYGQNELQNVGLGEWTLDPDLSTEQYLVLDKGETTKLVFRGRAGDNPVDNKHVADAFMGRPRDYTELDKLYEEVLATRPTGTSIEVVSYSNGGPKGLYLAEKNGLPHYTIDPVLGPKETQLLLNRKANTSAPLEIVRTTRPAIASTMGTTAQQILAGSDPPNAKILQVAPLPYTDDDGLVGAVIDAHDARHFLEANEGERVELTAVGKNLAGSVVAGVLPAAVASVAVEGLAPNQPHEAKLVETALGTAALGQVVSPLVGAGAAGATTTALPLVASFEAGDKVAQAVDAVLPDDLQGVPREVIKGGASGAAGGATFGAATVAQEAVVSTASSALTGTTTAAAAAAGEGGVELATLGAVGTTTLAEEVGIEAAIAAGTATGTITTAEFGPLALGGAAVGALTGLVIGLTRGRGGGATTTTSADYLKMKEEQLAREKELYPVDEEAEARKEAELARQRAEYLDATAREQAALYDQKTYLPEYNIAPQTTETWTRYFTEQIEANEPDADVSTRVPELLQAARDQNLVADAPPPAA